MGQNLKVYILHLKVKKAIFFSRTHFLSGWIEKHQLYDESEKKKKERKIVSMEPKRMQSGMTDTKHALLHAFAWG